MPVSMRIEALIAEAPTAAVVEVLEAREVSAGGQSCGVRYRGHLSLSDLLKRIPRP